MKFRVFAISIILLFLAGAWMWPSQAQRTANKSGTSGSAAGARGPSAKPRRPAQKGQALIPAYARAVGFAESKPVRSLPSAKSIAGGTRGALDLEEDEEHEKNVEDVRPRGSAKGSFDGALQATPKLKAPTALPTPSLTFDGIMGTDVNPTRPPVPPDTNGDVGPRHYVQTVNFLVGIWDKSGNRLVPYFKQSSLFAPLGGVASMVDRGDPIVLYDRMADRWMISQLAFLSVARPPYHEAIAISKTGDPTGGWYLYDFELPGEEFPDYPKFGVWPDGYYMTTDQFFRGGAFDGAGVFAFDRKKMLAGDPAAGLIYFSLDVATHPENIYGMLPADHDGILPPPAGAPEAFAYFTDTDFNDPADGLRLFDFHADFTNPAMSTFTERPESTYAMPLALAAFDARDPGGLADVEQPPPAGNVSTDRLDAVGQHLMHRLQYINRGGAESLVGNFTVNVSGTAPTSASTYQAGIRYFELRKTSPGGLYGVNEQATFAPGAGDGAAGDNRWVGSAAMDNQGNLMVGYSISGLADGHFPSLNYAARAFNDPPGGLFQGEGVMFAGTGVQRGSNNRWGDYSAMSLDPSDDCSFWYTNEYYATTASERLWRTRIGKVRFATCQAPAQGTLAGTVTFCDSGMPVAYATVTVTGGPSDGYSTTTAADGSYSLRAAAGSYSLTIAAPQYDCMTAAGLPVTINDAATTTLNRCLTGAVKFVYQSAAISGGNGDGIIQRDECNQLTVTLKNDGCFTADKVTAVLSSSTPGVTITQPASPFAKAVEGAVTTNSLPFQVSTASSFVCGTPIQFTLTISYAGGSAPVTFSLPTCVCPTVTVSGSLDGNDTTQMGGIPPLVTFPNSSCTFSKPCPTPSNTTQQFAYDLHSFTNGPAPACVTITTSGGCNALTAAYLGSFNPANLCANYLGDAANFPFPSDSFSVNVPANGVLLVNVHAALPDGCPAYTIKIDGLVCNTPGNGACAVCKLTCPANISKPNDANQCGALVSYPAPTMAENCGTASCSPASGGFFPVGTTTVLCTTSAGPRCTFTVTINDTQPPQITCPANVTAVTSQASCPSAACQAVNFPTPTASDNCPGVTVACSPASGSCFPRGTSSVTCTATDTSGNTASCSFTVAVFDVCMQDDTNPATVLLFNSQTGDYRLCCGGTVFTGRGKVRVQGCTISLEHTTTDRRLQATVDKGTFRGSASLQMPPGTSRCTITDRDIRNNSCKCP